MPCAGEKTKLQSLGPPGSVAICLTRAWHCIASWSIKTCTWTLSSLNNEHPSSRKSLAFIILTRKSRCEGRVKKEPWFIPDDPATGLACGSFSLPTEREASVAEAWSKSHRRSSAVLNCVEPSLLARCCASAPSCDATDKVKASPGSGSSPSVLALVPTRDHLLLLLLSSAPTSTQNASKALMSKSSKREMRTAASMRAFGMMIYLCCDHAAESNGLNLSLDNMKPCFRVI